MENVYVGDIPIEESMVSTLHQIIRVEVRIILILHLEAEKLIDLE
jgi:hypothetical protein